MFDPFNDYKASGYNPMSIPFIDNGFAVITKDNADDFDLRRIHGRTRSEGATSNRDRLPRRATRRGIEMQFTVPNAEGGQPCPTTTDPRDHRASPSRFGAGSCAARRRLRAAAARSTRSPGENGAGKSTLMNIIDGILRPDSGEICLDGEAVKITSPAVAQELGIGFVHQEIALCPDVTVAENIFMAETNASRALLMDTRACERRAARGPAPPRRHRSGRRWCARSRSRSQQLVEIAKALTLDCRVLILDEPTAALTEREAQSAVRDHARARGARHLDHLHLASHGGDLRRSATASRCCATAQYRRHDADVAETTPRRVGQRRWSAA